MKMKTLSVLSGAIMGVLASAGAVADDAAAVEERIKPIGTVMVAGSVPMPVAMDAAPTPAAEAAVAAEGAVPAEAPAMAEAPAAAAPAAGGGDATAVATQSGCLACHQVEVKVVGPSFKEVAAKYAGDASARDMLIAKVKNGGVGTWGQIPMPPNGHVPDENIAVVVDWVLSM